MSKEEKNINFDQHLRQRYAEHGANPPSGMWDKINDEFSNSSPNNFDEFIQNSYKRHEVAPPGYLGKKILLKSFFSKTSLLNYGLYKAASIVLFSSLSIITAYYLMNNVNDESSITEEKNSDKAPLSRTKKDIILDDSLLISNVSNRSNNNQNKNPIKHKGSMETEGKPAISSNDSKQKIANNDIPNLVKHKKVHDKIDHNLKEEIQLSNSEIKSDLNEKRAYSEKIAAISNIIGNDDKPTVEEKSKKTDNSLYEDNIDVEDLTSDLKEVQDVLLDSISHSKMNATEKIDIVNHIQKGKIQNGTSIEESFDNLKPNRSSIVDKNGNQIEKNTPINTTNISTKKSRNDSLIVNNLKGPNKNVSKDSTIQDAERSKNKTPKALSKFSITMLLSPTYSYRSLKTENEAISDFYNNNQEGNWQLNTRVLGTYHINEKWRVSSGISISRFEQKTSINNLRLRNSGMISNTRLNNRINVISSLGAVELDDLGRFGISEVSLPRDLVGMEDNNSDFSLKEEFEFTFLNIPLTIQYVMGNSKIRFVIEGGFQFSYLIDDRSKIEIIDNINPLLTSGRENYHSIKKNTISSVTSVGIEYEITQKIAFIFLPSFNYSLTNITRIQGNTLKPYYTSLSAGIRYHI